MSSALLVFLRILFAGSLFVAILALLFSLKRERTL